MDKDLEQNSHTEKKMAEQKGNNLDVQLYIFIIGIRWYMKVEIDTRNR